jgi:hypothetical protein
MALLANRFAFPAAEPDSAYKADRRAGVEWAARDWLETQARVAGFWRDMVADADGDLALVRALDAHREFLLAASNVRDS